MTGVRYDACWVSDSTNNPLPPRDLGRRAGWGETVVIILGLVFCVTWVVIFTQAYAVSRVEIEYGVLKTRIEKLEEELRNVRNSH